MRKGVYSSPMRSGSQSSRVNGSENQNPFGMVCTCLVPKRVVYRISRTLRNPGRPFIACPLPKEAGGCGLFCWVDPLPTFNMEVPVQVNAPQRVCAQEVPVRVPQQLVNAPQRARRYGVRGTVIPSREKVTPMRAPTPSQAPPLVPMPPPYTRPVMVRIPAPPGAPTSREGVPQFMSFIPTPGPQNHPPQP